MIHDPEPAAAAYLDGELDAATRPSFEAHMLECEQCWAQVAAARRGRALAEALREPAPSHLRETARAIAATPIPAHAAGRRRGEFTRRRVLVLGAGAAVTAAAASVELLWNGSHGHGDPLLAATEIFHGQFPTGRGIAPPVAGIDDLTWRGSSRVELPGHPAVAHRYLGPTGPGVLLVSCHREFPRPPGAMDLPDHSGWVADLDDCAVVCIEHAGQSWLSIAHTQQQALAAATAAGLRRT